MDIQVEGVLGFVLLIFTVLSLVVGAAGYYKGAATKSRIEALRGDLTDATNRHTKLKEDFDEAQQKQKEQAAVIDHLNDMVTGKQELHEIASILHTMDQRGKDIQNMMLQHLEDDEHA